MIEDDEITPEQKKKIQDILDMTHIFDLVTEQFLIEACVDKALEIAPNYRHILFEKFEHRKRRGAYDQANYYLDKILAKNPRDEDAIFAKGALFVELGLYTEAARWLNDGIRIRNEDETRQSLKNLQSWTDWNNQAGNDDALHNSRQFWDRVENTLENKTAEEE